MKTNWSTGDYCLASSVPDLDESTALAIYERVCRTDFNTPGFCLVRLGREVTSTQLRSCMVSLKEALRQIHHARMGRDLAVMSASRFDQQATTKLHRDGGPDECFLMLGYEPSTVAADVYLADYTRCADDMGLAPAEMLQRYNPMFSAGEELLRPYTTQMECFAHVNSQILLINNSVATYTESGSSWQGVLHTATIRNPSDEARRVVNSMLVASTPPGEPEPVSAAEQLEFIKTNLVRRSGYVQLLVILVIVLCQLAGQAAEPSPALDVTLRKPRDKAVVALQEDRATVSVESESGIGQAEFKPTAGKWPKSLVLSLGLKDLEGFYAENDALRIQTSLKHGKPEVFISLSAGERKEIPATDRHRMNVKRVGDRIELEIPSVLFSEGTKAIRVQWIDYYR